MTVIHIEILLNRGSSVAANSIPMPPNSSTKMIPSSGGRHKMECATIDGVSNMTNVIEPKERTMSSQLWDSLAEFCHEGRRSLDGASMYLGAISC